eukprot:gnl/TRDRNA2_/TRDRNA2_50569_c0_seq1.p1 gnl/TRDRNA2_/TRDRNA2_50569_c0~~gnl/TRDRNA2_/TRDRNA2_50569_c0_seq1.p1  ORF type:complete len:113 (+),score=13.04 gnl/TRDRNA2_/TRDRNA2_50569_c0_seq1:257-595(+)
MSIGLSDRCPLVRYAAVIVLKALAPRVVRYLGYTCAGKYQEMFRRDVHATLYPESPYPAGSVSSPHALLGFLVMKGDPQLMETLVEDLPETLTQAPEILKQAIRDVASAAHS